MDNAQIAARAYGRAAVTTGGPEQLLLLYDQAISHIQQAKEAITMRAHQQRYDAIEQACTILLMLQSSLDEHAHPQTAQILHGYYTAMDTMLLAIQLNNDTAMCDQAMMHLKRVRDCWKEHMP